MNPDTCSIALMFSAVCVKFLSSRSPFYSLCDMLQSYVIVTTGKGRLKKYFFLQEALWDIYSQLSNLGKVTFLEFNDCF